MAATVGDPTRSEEVMLLNSEAAERPGWFTPTCIEIIKDCYRRYAAKNLLPSTMTLEEYRKNNLDHTIDLIYKIRWAEK